MIREDYSAVRAPIVDANNFELKLIRPTHF